MTLRSDLELIATNAEMDAADLDRLASDEHARYRWYLDALSNASEAAEQELVNAVLRDPDRVMSEAAVVAYIDRMASRKLPSAGFAAWAETFLDAVRDFGFARQRIDEWLVFKRIMEGDADLESLRDGSDWLQRRVAEEATSPVVLQALAITGRTKRIRSTARSRQRSPRQS